MSLNNKLIGIHKEGNPKYNVGSFLNYPIKEFIQQYSDFTDAQKIILCGSPDGVLYRKEDESIVILSKDDLKKAIVGDEDYSIKEIGLQEFSEIVGDLYYKYNGTHNIRN